MLAASVWSLLVPALRLSAEPRWLPAALGFLSGGLCLRLVDQFLPHMQLQPEYARGIAHRLEPHGLAGAGHRLA